jgi:hypothetical protein
MSPERDELARLVGELRDEDVPTVLAEVRRRPHPERIPESEWPPPWFGMIEGDGTAVGRRSEELLAEGFGR